MTMVTGHSAKKKNNINERSLEKETLKENIYHSELVTSRGNNNYSEIWLIQIAWGKRGIST